MLKVYPNSHIFSLIVQGESSDIFNVSYMLPMKQFLYSGGHLIFVLELIRINLIFKICFIHLDNIWPN